MSAQCKLASVPVAQLKPKWVEFTDTKGVLRVLKPNEDTTRARGMIFNCPRCRHDKQKEHYCIFLFANAPTEARPHGRFILDLLDHAAQLKEPLSKLSLYMTTEAGAAHMLLKPADLKCGWQGYFANGIVSWKQTLLEKLRLM